MANFSDLVSYCEHFAGTIPEPDDAKAPTVVFAEDTLPAPPASLLGTGIRAEFLRTGYHGHAPVEGVHLHADKSSLRALALLTLAVVFRSDTERVRIDLSFSDSPKALKYLLLEFPSPTRLRPQYGAFHQVPEYFCYAPRPGNERHPLANRFQDRRDLPHIHVTNLDQMHVRDDEQNTIVGFGTALGAVRIAEALLNATHQSTTRDEFDFEQEIGGFESVAPGSAELKIWLPGSFGW